MDCKDNYKEIELLKDKISQLEKENRENRNRIIEIEKNNSVQEYQYKNIMKMLEKLEKNVESLTSAPNKKWDTLITATISSIVSFLTGLVMRR